MRFMILFVYAIQDVLKGIAKREKWDLKDLTTFKLHAKKFKFGTLRKYEFRVRIGMTEFVFLIEDEIFQWKSLQFHDNESDFDSLFKEIDSKATVDVLQIQWSFELYATGDAHLFLTFPVCIINIDRLCGSPTVISSPSRSLFNKENNVESRSTEEYSKGVDHGQARL